MWCCWRKNSKNVNRNRHLLLLLCSSARLLCHSVDNFRFLYFGDFRLLRKGLLYGFHAAKDLTIDPCKVLIKSGLIMPSGLPVLTALEPVLKAAGMKLTA